MTEALHVVGLSGGKDSTAMALALAEREPQKYLYVCTPTGDELPEMEAHWTRLQEILGQKIIRLDSGKTLDSLIQHYGALPNWRQRWCTRELKIEPYERWLKEQAAKGPVVSYIGLRADEDSFDSRAECHLAENVLMAELPPAEFKPDVMLGKADPTLMGIRYKMTTGESDR